MDLNSSNTAGVVTPVKNPRLCRSKSDDHSRNSENFNPNTKSPGLKCTNSPSPLIKSATKSQKTVKKKKCSSPIASKPMAPPLQIKDKIRERKFVVIAKKKNSKREKVDSSTTVVCNCDSKANGVPFKCRCVAYETLRASQEEFFKRSSSPDDETEKELNKLEDENHVAENQGLEEKVDLNEIGVYDSSGKRTRDKLLEDKRESLPGFGSGKVMQLVKAFENILTLPKSKNSEENGDDDDDESGEVEEGDKWACPGMRPLNFETQISSSTDFLFTSQSLGLSSSLDRNQRSNSSRSSGGRRRSRRNSAESSGRFAGNHRRRGQLRATNQKPFMLRTEQRGRHKQEEFVKKVHEMMEEEEKQRIPIAQGLPWTTDEPECLVKPPVKESTRPIDLVLHSDVRAEERAEFDHEVAEKMSLIEQYKMERERQKKLEEEEEIRRLRKELVPKAQPMPYFDRPLVPKRSEKHPTIPREPKFHLPQHKKSKSSMSWSDVCYDELQ